jgi:hypothetical protein
VGSYVADEPRQLSGSKIIFFVSLLFFSSREERGDFSNTTTLERQILYSRISCRLSFPQISIHLYTFTYLRIFLLWGVSGYYCRSLVLFFLYSISDSDSFSSYLWREESVSTQNFISYRKLHLKGFYPRFTYLNISQMGGSM